MGETSTESEVCLDNPDPPITGEVDGNSLHLHTSGKERVTRIVELIDGASTTIRLLFYLFEADDCGTRVRDALARAAERGVEVRMILDDFGTNNAPKGFFDPIEGAGGDTCVFHPHIGRRYFIRNHQKLAIFDEEVALIGGANLAEDYLSDGRVECWRDLWLTIEGPSVCDAVAYFDRLKSWTQQGKSSTTALRDIICDHSQSEGRLRWLFGGPRPRISPMLSSIVRDIDQAKQLGMVAAYFSPSKAMLRRIGNVSARGGEATVITAGKSDNNATIAAARHTYSRLLRRGVEIYEFDKCRLHMKLIVVDDMVYIGSSNFDFRSLYINLELMLRIEDADFAKAMREFVHSQADISTHVTPELHRKRRNWWRRFKWAVSRWLVTTMDYTVSRRFNFPLTDG